MSTKNEFSAPDVDPIEGERFDGETAPYDFASGNAERLRATRDRKLAELAGPETAAEHVRNAEQIIRGMVKDLEVAHREARSSECRVIIMEVLDATTAARARLGRALAALEGP
jgi:hypothetical protein